MFTIPKAGGGRSNAYTWLRLTFATRQDCALVVKSFVHHASSTTAKFPQHNQRTRVDLMRLRKAHVDALDTDRAVALSTIRVSFPCAEVGNALFSHGTRGRGANGRWL